MRRSYERVARYADGVQNAQANLWFVNTALIAQAVAMCLQLGGVIAVSAKVYGPGGNSITFPGVASVPKFIGRVGVELDEPLRATDPVTTFNDFQVTLEFLAEPTVTFSLAAVIFTFLSLSFVAEGVGIYHMLSYRALLEKGDDGASAAPQYWPVGVEMVFLTRSLEYSVTASIMLIVIAVQVGIWDWRTILCICCLSFLCMLFGWISERLMKADPAVSIATHVLGWVAVIAAWYPMLWTFFTSASFDDGRPKPPDAVYAIVWVECSLWMVFGFVQSYQIVSYNWPWLLWKPVYHPIEVFPVYSILSASAKFILAMLVVFPTLL